MYLVSATLGSKTDLLQNHVLYSLWQIDFDPRVFLLCLVG